MREVNFVEKRSMKEWLRDNQIGICVTIIFHLLVLLLLTINGIRTRLGADYYEVSMEQHDLAPNLEEEAEKQEALEKEVQDMLNNVSRPSISLPNIVVNATGGGDGEGRGEGGGTQRDMALVADKSKPAEKTNPTEERAKTSEGLDDIGTDAKQNDSKDGKAYQGPSVVSYSLDGRSAIYMPVPAYKCRAGGDVTVLIEVNRLGYVVSVEVDRKVSSRDDCLHEAAMEAASLARFTTKPVLTPNQKGNIVYRFVPQNR